MESIEQSLFNKSSMKETQKVVELTQNSKVWTFSKHNKNFQDSSEYCQELDTNRH
jgi:hypothetical protein